MFLSMQSLNGDSYQGAQVGANVQSQVGAPTRTVPDNAVQRAVRVLPLCWTEPSTEQPESSQKVNSIWPSIGFFALDGTFCLPKYIPPHRFQARLLAQILKHFNLCECTWLWLELLGWYWVFGYVVLPFFLYFYIAVSSCYCVLLSSILYIV